MTLDVDTYDKIIQVEASVLTAAYKNSGFRRFSALLPSCPSPTRKVI